MTAIEVIVEARTLPAALFGPKFATVFSDGLHLFGSGDAPGVVQHLAVDAEGALQSRQVVAQGCVVQAVTSTPDAIVLLLGGLSDNRVRLLGLDEQGRTQWQRDLPVDRTLMRYPALISQGHPVQLLWIAGRQPARLNLFDLESEGPVQLCAFERCYNLLVRRDQKGVFVSCLAGAEMSPEILHIVDDEIVHRVALTGVDTAAHLHLLRIEAHLLAAWMSRDSRQVSAQWFALDGQPEAQPVDIFKADTETIQSVKPLGGELIQVVVEHAASGWVQRSHRRSAAVSQQQLQYHQHIIGYDTQSETAETVYSAPIDASPYFGHGWLKNRLILVHGEQQNKVTIFAA